MLEVEQAGVNSEAQMRLEQMRQQMGLPAGDQGALAQLPASSRQALVGDSQPAAALGPPAQAEGTGPAPASHTEG
jgi:hypothetical protein